MDDSQALAEKLTELQNAYHKLAFAMRLLVGCLNIGLGLVCLGRCWSLPVYKEMIAGMGDGAPLPTLTAFVFNNSGHMGLLALMMPMVALTSLGLIKSINLAVLIAIATAALLWIELTLVSQAALQPLISIMNALGGVE